MQKIPTLPFLLIALLLCHCSVKHQPIVLAPYFPASPDRLDFKARLLEIESLESRNDLSPYQKKRLSDLYAWEERGVKVASHRVERIREAREKFAPEIAPLEEETQSLMIEFLNQRQLNEKAEIYKTEGLRRSVQDIQKIWSRDENELALQRTTQLLEREKDFTKAERIRLRSLQFRIAYDLGNEEVFAKAVEHLSDLDECAPETTHSNFLLSIYSFSKGDSARARSLFKDICEDDKGISTRIRNAYWWYRFQEKGSPEEIAAYESLKQLPLPGYYLYLAQAARGEAITLPLPDAQEPAFSGKILAVSKKVHEDWSAAEAKIQAGLRQDAVLHLLRASTALRSSVEKNVLPLVYTAHLFKAAGNHLEAMKIFSDLTGAVDKDPAVAMEYLREFPRPFEGKVEWVSKKWDVDPDYVYSIMRQESAFNPGAVSTADARGLMQLMPSLARQISKQWGVQKIPNDEFLFRGEENIKISVFHLHQLRKLVPHPALIAGAYNAGVNRTSNWWRKFGHKPLDVFVEEIPVNETRNYIKLVLRNYIYYKALRNGGKVSPDLFPLELPAYAGGVSSAQTTIRRTRAEHTPLDTRTKSVTSAPLN